MPAVKTKASRPPSAAASSPALQRAAMDEVVEGEGGARVVAGEEVAHVVRDPGETLQAGAVVEEPGDLGGGHALFLDQVQDDPGVELARAGAHRQAVERREAHRALDAPARQHRAHRGAAAEVGDDDAPAGGLRRHLGQAVGDILVAEAVEAVAADALVVERARQRVAVGVRRRGRDGRRCRSRRPAAGPGSPPSEADRREVVRLVQRRQRLVAGRAGRGRRRRSGPARSNSGRRARRGGRRRRSSRPSSVSSQARVSAIAAGRPATSPGW